MHHTIYPIFNGCFSISFKTVPSMKDIHSFAFLIVDDQGDCVLLDTGFSSDYIPGPNTSSTQTPEDRIDVVLMKMGFDPVNIKHVIMTHLHWDHTAGMSFLPRAQFYIQAEDFRGLLRLNPNEETYFCPAHWLPLLSRVEMLEGNFELKPGLRLIYTGGHTKGHQVVEIDTKQGTVMLGGDVPFNYDQLWEMIPAAGWKEFREGPGKRFYWDESVLPTIQSYLEKNNCLQPVQHPSIGMKEIKSRGPKLITSHDPRLLNIKSIP